MLALALSLSFCFLKKKGFCQPTAFGLKWKLCFLGSAASLPACLQAVDSPAPQLHGPIKLSLLCPGSRTAGHLLWLLHDFPGLIPLAQGGPDFMGQGLHAEALAL